MRDCKNENKNRTRKQLIPSVKELKYSYTVKNSLPGILWQNKTYDLMNLKNKYPITSDWADSIMSLYVVRGRPTTTLPIVFHRDLALIQHLIRLHSCKDLVKITRPSTGQETLEGTSIKDGKSCWSVTDEELGHAPHDNKSVVSI